MGVQRKKERNKYISLNIKHLRKQKKISKTSLGRSAGVTIQSITDYEEGVSEASIEVLLKICKVLEVDLHTLSTIDLSVYPFSNSELAMKRGDLFKAYAYRMEEFEDRLRALENKPNKTEE